MFCLKVKFHEILIIFHMWPLNKIKPRVSLSNLVPTRTCRGAFGVDVSAVLFDKGRRGLERVRQWDGGRALECHMEFKEPRWVSRRDNVKVENTFALSIQTPAYLWSKSFICILDEDISARCMAQCIHGKGIAAWTQIPNNNAHIYYTYCLHIYR